MKCLGDDTRVYIVRSVKRSILSSTKRRATRQISKRLFGSRALAIGIALGMLLAGLTLSPSMRPLTHGGSVNAADESISTFVSTDCTTPKNSWNLGETACAVATGAPDDQRIEWVAPNGSIARITNYFSGTLSDSYTIPTGSDPFAQVGTWTVATVDPRGVESAAATFVVRDPANHSADLSVRKYGPFETTPGANINYRLELTNNGPDDAQAVTLSDSVPANTTFVSEVQDSGPAFTCVTPTVGSGTGTVTCTIATLPANAIAVFSLAFNVNGGTPDGSIITNSASVSSTTNELHQADNSASSSARVTVVSSVCSINCPSNITQDNDANQCSAVVNYSTPTTSGSCGSPPDNTVICNPPSGSTFPTGTTPVNCSTQSGGACSFTVTVHDTRTPVQPTITCPSNQTSGEDSPGSGSATVNYPPPTTTGNCITTVCDPPSGSSFRVGTTQVNCTATDSSNNSVNCSFTVTVTSGSACTIRCPGDVTETAPSGQCNAVVTYSDPTTSGNCGTVTCTPASGSTFQSGTTAVTCTSSQGPSCSFTVTVNASGPPTITTCASNKTLSVNANCEAVIPNLVGPTPPTEVVTTGCSVTLSQSPTAGTVVGPGTYAVTITAENSAGAATCTATVTVADTTPPVITTCPAATSASADANCQAPVPDVTTGVTATDNCTPSGSLTVTQNPAAGTLVGKGQNTITITVKDQSNNSATCTTTFTVNDTTPPTISCPADITKSNDPGLCSAVVAFAPTVNDNCPGATATCSPASGSTFPKGTTTVTCTATDASGNTSATSCTFTVTVNDTENPTVTCPASITKANDPGQCSAVVTYTATATDNCTGVGAVTCSPVSGSVFPKGTTTVTCSATDASNNTGSCSFTVTVNDTEKPTISCPANITKANDPGQCSAVVSFSATASDNCPGATSSCSPASGSVFPKGTTTVTCTATDASGNTSATSCTFTVTVNDTERPTISCPSNMTKSTDPNVCSAVVSFSPTASDNCPGVGTPSCTPPSGSTFPKGTTTVTCTVSDASNNSASCTFTVTVNDTQPPTISCPGNVVGSTDPNQCSAVVTYPGPSASDNCPGVTAVCTPASGSTFPKGTTVVTCTATDTSNNSSSCSFSVTVNDTQPPAITCPANIVVEPTCPSGAVVTYTAPVGTDNCPGAVTTQTAGLASGSIFPIGTTTNTFKVTDTSGNMTTCSFTVKVKTPAEVIQDLINRVQALMDQGVLTQSNGNALLNRLEAARDDVNSGNTGRACSDLDSFIDKVQGYIEHGTLTSAQGQPLINSAKNAQNGLGCKPVSCT